MSKISNAIDIICLPIVIPLMKWFKVLDEVDDVVGKVSEAAAAKIPENFVKRFNESFLSRLVDGPNAYKRTSQCVKNFYMWSALLVAIPAAAILSFAPMYLGFVALEVVGFSNVGAYGVIAAMAVASVPSAMFGSLFMYAILGTDAGAEAALNRLACGHPNSEVLPSGLVYWVNYNR